MISRSAIDSKIRKIIGFIAYFCSLNQKRVGANSPLQQYISDNLNNLLTYKNILQ